MRPQWLRYGGWAALVVLTVLLAMAFYWVGWVHGGPFDFSHEGVEYQLLRPRALGLLLATPLLLWVLGRSLADLPWQQRVFGVFVRIGFLAFLALALAGVVRTATSEKVCTVLLVDVSESVPDAAIEDARQAVSDAWAARGGAEGEENLVKLVTFADRPRAVELREAEGALVVPEVAALRHRDGEGRALSTAGTDLQAALQLAYGLFPQGYLKRVALLSDGVETKGDVLAEVARAAKSGIRVHAIPYRQPTPGEVSVLELRVPDKVEIGQPFQVVADVYSSRDTSARVRLYQGEVLNGLDGVRTVELKAGENRLAFQSVVRFGGEVTYKVELDRVGDDKFSENNRYQATLEVPGRPTVLYVEGQPARASYLSSALSAQQFDVDVRAASGFPGSLGELERYDMLIVSDVPSEAVSLSSQDLIERYVRDLGGGFLFAGGESGFGLGGWGHTPIERILPVRMDVQHKKDMPSVALSLVIDRSGSMTGLPIEMAKAACAATVGTLEGDDLVEIIAFDSSPRRYVKMQPARYRSRIQGEIAQIQPGGGTAIFPALDAAYQDISVVQARKKHVILLTDGRADSHGIRDLVQAMIAENITVTAVGLGDGADGDLLRLIADTGGGRYHHVPDPNSLPRIFTRETEMIARQAAVEEWFPVFQTSRADFLQGIAVNAAPLLHGYVATEMKGPPAQQILASDKGEPILARWRVGLGHTLAWTSDVKNHWAVDWLRWSGFSRFFGQLVREHMRKKHRRELDMRTEVVDGRIRATVDAFNAQERFENRLRPELTITGSDSEFEPQTRPMVRIAPGRYQAEFELEQYGSFRLKAKHFRETDDGELKAVGVSFGHVSHPYPREYASFEPDLARLSSVAQGGGGKVDPKATDLFEAEGETIEFQEPVWPLFIYWALGLFVLDLLLRRLRLFDRGFRRGRSLAM